MIEIVVPIIFTIMLSTIAAWMFASLGSPQSSNSKKDSVKIISPETVIDFLKGHFKLHNDFRYLDLFKKELNLLIELSKTNYSSTIDKNKLPNYDYNLIKRFEDKINFLFPKAPIKKIWIENKDYNDAGDLVFKEINNDLLELSESFYPKFYKEDYLMDVILEESYLYKHLTKELLNDKSFTKEEVYILLNSIDFKNLKLSIPYYLANTILIKKTQFFCETKFKRIDSFYQNNKVYVYKNTLNRGYWNKVQKDFENIETKEIIKFFNRNLDKNKLLNLKLVPWIDIKEQLALKPNNELLNSNLFISEIDIKEQLKNSKNNIKKERTWSLNAEKIYI